MKEYTYKKVKLWKSFGALLENHRQIIDEYAAQGYRYAGYIPTDINARGVIVEIDLILKRRWRQLEGISYSF